VYAPTILSAPKEMRQEKGWRTEEGREKPLALPASAPGEGLKHHSEDTGEGAGC
jgi:hypothetical protein